MHATTRNQNRSSQRRELLAGVLLAVGSVVGGSPLDASASRPPEGVTIHDAHRYVSPGGPRLVRGAVADVLVRVRGGAVCSGTPITGTRYVVTAAHCVLDRHGDAAARTVVRDGETYTATAVYVADRYFDAPEPQLDAAVLVMDEVLPGLSATIGATIPTTGTVTVAGFQPLDTDGTLLRGTRPHDLPTPKGATGNLIKIESAPTGCTVPTGSLSVTDSSVEIPCGLIPGASGGGMFTELDGTIVLVGIVSTVSVELSSNGVVPLESLHELLRDPAKYRHDVRATRRTSDPARVALS
ncbi:MAG: serine protease [Acidimicrobiia bacterium]